MKWEERPPPRRAKINNYNIMRKIIDIYPEAPNTWVYRDHPDDPMPDGTPRRQFEPSVTIPLSDLDLWHECTDQQRRDWEAQHPEAEPTPEPTIHLEPTEPSPDPSESEPVAGVVDPANEGKEAEV